MEEIFAYLYCSSEEQHLGKYPLKSLDKKEIFKCSKCGEEVTYYPNKVNARVKAVKAPHVEHHKANDSVNAIVKPFDE
jgi:hypothetical protein